MSFSPGCLEPQSPEMMLSGVRMNLENTFSSMQEDAKSDNMKVFARVRPMLQREEDAGYRECIGVIDDKVVRAVVPESSVKFKNSAHSGQEIYEDFTYTQAFGPETGQFVFFEQTIMDIMQSFIEGQNCLVFSYGITNSGKTFTLQGDDANPGIIPLAMRLFFASIKHQVMDGISVKSDKFAEMFMLTDNERSREQQLKDQLLQLLDQETANKTSSSSGNLNLTKTFAMTLCDCFNDDFKYETETTLPPEEMMAAQSALLMKELSKQSADQQAGSCSIWVSFIEIYNEYIYDLLQPNIAQRGKLMLAEDQNGEVYVKGAREICISNSDEAIKLLNLGRRNLRIASTKLNYQSSRSHCIFTIKVIRLYDNENGRVNRISFCDLAGSERAAKSQTSGVHLKEAGYINTSLLVLGRCLEQLRLNQTARDKKMIPYRESKLTRLFSGHFLGKGKAVMIANASPCEFTFDESLNVLRFSALLKQLKLNDSYISTASSSLRNITDQWQKSRVQTSDVSLDQSSDFDNSLWTDLQEKDEMIEKLLDIADSLRNNLEKEKKEKAELEIKIRQDVCREYSEYSDTLIANQQRIADESAGSMKAIHQKRLIAMEQIYEERINELKLQLKEYESFSDESYNDSVNKGNVTLELKDSGDDDVIPPSPRPFMKLGKELNQEKKTDTVLLERSIEYQKCTAENHSLKLDLSTVKNELQLTTEKLQKCEFMITDLQNEIKQYEEKVSEIENNPTDNAHVKVEISDEVEKQVEDMNSLREDLNFLTKEFEKTKEQLELTSETLKESQTEEAISKEKCATLNSKLQEATEVLEEYKKEFDQLKSSCITSEDKIERLIEEKKNMEDSIFTLSEQLANAVTDVEQMKLDKIEAEKHYSIQCEEFEKKLTNAKDQCKDLNLQLEEATKVLAEEKFKICTLESECVAYKDSNSKLLAESRTLEEKLSLVSEQLEAANAEDKFEALSLKLEEVTKNLAEEKAKFGGIDSQCENHRNNFSKLLEDFNFSEEKHAVVSNQLAVATADMKKLLKEKLEAEEIYVLQSVESLKKITNAENKIKDLNLKLEDATHALAEEKSKFVDLDSQCDNYRNANSKLSEDYKILEDKCALLSNQLETNKFGDQGTDLSLKLEEATQALVEEKAKLFDLVSQCENYKNTNSKLSDDNKILEEKHVLASKLLEEVRADVKCKELENNLQIMQEDKCRTNELETKCESYQLENVKLKEDLKSLEEKFTFATEQLATAQLEIEHLQKEIPEAMDVNSKSLSDLKMNEVCINDKCKELELELKSNLQIMQEDKCKTNELETKCNSYELENIKFKEDLKSLEERFALATEQLAAARSEIKLLQKEISEAIDVNSKSFSDLKMKEAVVQEKYNELLMKHEESIQAIENGKSMISQLELDCAAFQTQNAQLLESIKGLEEECATLRKQYESSHVDDKCTDLNHQLEKASQELEDQKLKYTALDKKYENINEQLVNRNQTVEDQTQKIYALELECTTCKNDNAKLLEDYISLEQQFGTMKEQIGAKEDSSDLQSQLNQLETECTLHKNSCAKMSENYKTLNEAFTALAEEMASVKNDREHLKREGLENKESHAKSITELQEREESARKKVEDLNNQIEEISVAKGKCEDEIQQLKSECSAYEEKIETENNNFKAQLEEISGKNLQSLKEYTERVAELEKILSSDGDKIQELTESVETLQKFKEGVSVCMTENELHKEQILELKNRAENTKLLQEQSGQLMFILEKCEFLASQKIKLLHALSMKNVEEMTDMKRHIKEKETSIEELEKALCDSQKQRRDMDAKIKKQLVDFKQQSSVMEEIEHKRKLVEAANFKLKADLDKLKKEETDQVVEKKSSTSSMGGRKRPSNEMSKEVDENIEEKENSERTSDTKTNKKKKTSNPSKEVKENAVESEALPKRRRVLRQKQPEIEMKEVLNDSFQVPVIEVSDDDYEPTKSKATRKKKEIVKKDIPKPKRVPSRRKLQEQENESPVKKALNYVGSKIRSVAQSVSSMPSPRITRGRKKLFNADAVPSGMDKKDWRF